MFLNSKMPFGSGFVFSRIHTTELIFYQLLLALDRSLKLIWIVLLYATSLLPCKGYGVKNFSLIRTHLFFPKQDIQWTCKIFSASRLLQPVYFLFVFSLTKWDRLEVCQEKISCLYVQLFYCSRTDLFFLYVCHNQAS